MKTKTIIFAMILIMSLSLASADQNCPGGLPNEYYGDIYVDGGWFGLVEDKPLVGEYTLTVTVDNANSGSQFINDGTYSLDVSPCYGTSGGEIKFIINGVEAKQKAIYTSESATSTNLDLILESQPSPDSGCGDEEINAGEECDDGNALSGDGCSEICEVEFGYTCKAEPSICSSIGPYCGDGVCNGGETCSTCSTDCGACAAPKSSSSGGGGGSSTPAVIPEIQNETEGLNATNETGLGISITSLNEGLDDEVVQVEEKRGFFNWITGRAITGSAVDGESESKSGKGWLVLIILSMIGYFFLKKKYKQNVFSKKSGKKKKKYDFSKKRK